MKDRKVSNIHIGGHGGSVDLELLEVQLGQLQGELEFLYRDNQEKESIASKYKEKIVELERSIRGLTWEKGNLKRILDEERNNKYNSDLLQREKALFQENESLKSELEVAQSAIARLEGKVHKKDASSEGDGAIVGRLKQDLDALGEENQISRMALDQLGKELEDLMSDLANKDRLIKELNEKISVKNSKLKRLSEKKRILAGEVQDLSLRLVEAEAGMGDLKGRLERRSITKLLGKRLKNRSDKKTSYEKECVELIRNSEVFDASWYLRSYPDVSEGKVDPAEHYFYFGALEGRDPSPYFSTEWYVGLHKFVDFSAVNPLVHYLEKKRA